MRDRRAEERHHAVAGELIDDALEAIDLAEGELEVLVEQVAVLLGIEALGDRGRADEVAEEHGDQLALAGDGPLRGADLVREILGNVPREAVEAVLGGRRSRRGRRGSGVAPSAKPHSGQKRNSGLMGEPQFGHVSAVRVPHE